MSKILLCIAMGFFALGIQAQPLNVSFNFNGLEKVGLKLSPYGARDFQAKLSKLIEPGTSPGTEGIYPYSFILENATDRTILMYSARWQYDGPNNTRPYVTINTWNLSGSQGSKSDDIGPHSSRLVTPVFRLGRSPAPQAPSDNFSQLLSNFSRSSSVVVSLESVMWEDFSHNGPDGAKAMNQVMGRMNAERDLIEQISSASSEDAVRKMLDREAGAARSTPSFLFSGDYDTAYKYYKQSLAKGYLGQAADGKTDKLVQMANRLLKSKRYMNLKRENQ